MTTFAQIEQQIVNLLPASGEVPYAEFVQSMNVAGLGQHTARLFIMRKRGLLNMAVRYNGDALEHVISRAGGD